jgi:Flp pilus assembly protein TadG
MPVSAPAGNDFLQRIGHNMKTDRIPRGTPKRRSLLSRFWSDRGGVTAVEFALVGPPFIVLLIGLVEVTISYFASIALENGLETVARQIRTGEVQTQGLTAAEFKSKLCDQVSPIIPCDANLYVDARVFTDFGSTETPPPPLDPVTHKINPAFTFDPGTAGSIVLVRAFYVWSINTPLLGSLLGNMTADDGSTNTDMLLGSAAVFRNEPFGGS